MQIKANTIHKGLRNELMSHADGVTLVGLHTSCSLLSSAERRAEGKENSVLRRAVFILGSASQVSQKARRAGDEQTVDRSRLRACQPLRRFEHSLAHTQAHRAKAFLKSVFRR